MRVPKVTVKQDRRGSFYLEYTFNGLRPRPRVGNNQEEAEESSVFFRQCFRQGMDPLTELERVARQRQQAATTLRQFFDIFKSRHGNQQSKGMQANYQIYFENICRLSSIADIPLAHIAKAAVLDYMIARQRQDNITPGTASHEGRFINCMLNRAVEWDLIERNPLAGIKFPANNKRRRVDLTIDQAKKLLAVLPDGLKVQAELAIYTGWRKSNIRLLRIEQVRFFQIGPASGEATFIAKGGVEQTHPLSDAAAGLLRKEIGERLNGYVFLNHKTRQVYSRSGYNAFDKAVIGQGLMARDGSKLRWHDLRHACAGFLKNLANASLDDIREVLGHSNRSTTDRYTSYNRNVVGLLNQIPRLG